MNYNYSDGNILKNYGVDKNYNKSVDLNKYKNTGLEYRKKDLDYHNYDKHIYSDISKTGIDYESQYQYDKPEDIIKIEDVKETVVNFVKNGTEFLGKHVADEIVYGMVAGVTILGATKLKGKIFDKIYKSNFFKIFSSNVSKIVGKVIGGNNLIKFDIVKEGVKNLIEEAGGLSAIVGISGTSVLLTSENKNSIQKDQFYPELKKYMENTIGKDLISMQNNIDKKFPEIKKEMNELYENEKKNIINKYPVGEKREKKLKQLQEIHLVESNIFFKSVDSVEKDLITQNKKMEDIKKGLDVNEFGKFNRFMHAMSPVIGGLSMVICSRSQIFKNVVGILSKSSEKYSEKFFKKVLANSIGIVSSVLVKFATDERVHDKDVQDLLKNLKGDTNEQNIPQPYLEYCSWLFDMASEEAMNIVQDFGVVPMTGVFLGKTILSDVIDKKTGQHGLEKKDEKEIKEKIVTAIDVTSQANQKTIHIMDDFINNYSNNLKGIHIEPEPLTEKENEILNDPSQRGNLAYSFKTEKNSLFDLKKLKITEKNSPFDLKKLKITEED